MFANVVKIYTEWNVAMFCVADNWTQAKQKPEQVEYR